MPRLKRYLASGILAGVISAGSFGLYFFTPKDNNTVKRIEYLAEYIPSNILEYPEYTLNTQEQN